MKVLTTAGLTKLIQLCKSAFVDKTDVVETQTVTLATVATSGSYNDLSNKPNIPTVNNATLTIQKNGTTVKTFTANASSNVTANITVPTNNNELTNGAGYITGITSAMVTTALGYTPYNSTNPNGYTSNTGTVTSVNNVSPVNGNVSLSIPTVNNPTITLTQGGVTKGSFTLNQSTGDTIALDAGGSVKTFDLFDHKWSDYQLNDMAWLRADTFSWQDGTVYSDAYNHLVSDYNGGTSQTETVGSYTITYVLATDGHKITTDETNVSNIYNESGVAWYYILDTTNQRFKLPRVNPAREELIQVIRAKGNGISLGLTNGTNNAGFEPVSGLGVTAIQQAYGLNVGDSVSGSTGLTNGIAVGITIDSTKSGIISDMTDSTSVYKGKRYLYFYVGQYSQSATEQTAGLNAELFNGKMDLDMSNMNPSQTAKQTIIRLSEPDWSAGVDIEVPVQATPYVCPSDGVYCFCFMPASTQSNLFVNGVKTAVCMRNSSSNNANKASSSAVLQKNDSIYFDVGTTTANTFSSTFYPLKGVTNA